MRLRINGEYFEFFESLTVEELIKKRDIQSPKMVDVKLNKEKIPLENYKSTRLRDNDNIEFLFSMSEESSKWKN